MEYGCGKSNVIFWNSDIDKNVTRNARFMSKSNKNDPLESGTYVHVVSRDIVYVVLLLAALNDIYVLNTYIQVAHPNAT